MLDIIRLMTRGKVGTHCQVIFWFEGSEFKGLGCSPVEVFQGDDFEKIFVPSKESLLLVQLSIFIMCLGAISAR